MIPLAVGTQTGGSVIRPASFCGVAAIKPSYRMLPTVGVKCFSWTLDTVGLFAAGVEDLARGLAAMTGRPELRLVRSRRRRSASSRRNLPARPRRRGSEALRIAAARRRRRGASVRELKLPAVIAEAWRIHPTVQQFEAHQAFAWEYRENYDAMPPLLRGRLDDSAGHPAAEYDEAREIAAESARGVVRDLPRGRCACWRFSAPGAAPKGLDSTGDTRFNRLWTLMGTPCVNVPAHVAGGGLPVGVQIIARLWRRRKGAGRGALP